MFYLPLVFFIEFIKTKRNNEVAVKFSTGSTWLSTNYPNSSCTDETKAVCSELLNSVFICQELHVTCSYCRTCDFSLQEPEASFLSPLCFSILFMTIGTSVRSAKTMRRTILPEVFFFLSLVSLNFVGQILAWFHVDIQRRRLPYVFFPCRHSALCNLRS
jgi:hypothetical protein